ncbi:MAG: HAMP domain-containing histidine kinase [Halieaceae bacterium]|nr:HAMP domain-containing histidine kinase [Halieaceae bacterium]
MNTPPAPDNSAYNPSLDNLRSLLLIRGIALLGQTGVLIYVLYASRTTEGLWGVTISLALLAILTAISLWRCTRSWPVTDNEFLGQLLVDVVGWTALMYFTGGASNPFVSYYIVPLVIAAAVLPWRHTWLVAGISLLAYSVLLYYYRPFPLFTPHAHMGHAEDAQVHILGMWFNFLFSAGLITYFVVRMASMLRQQEARAVARREDRLRNDQIMAVASLAAGTAHELGTPLGTMTVLVDEMLLDGQLPPQAREDCQLLKQQLVQCKKTLAGLTRTAELSSVAQTRSLPLDQFVQQTVQRWAVRRPGVVCDTHSDSSGAAPLIDFDSTLCQALENLLNNAADTGTDRVRVSCAWDAGEARIAIRDWGPGIDVDILQDIGKPVIRASRDGLGIGLLLSHATVERYGGRIELLNASDGGAVATLYLPLPPHATEEPPA